MRVVLGTKWITKRKNTLGEEKRVQYVAKNENEKRDYIKLNRVLWFRDYEITVIR